jgi:hypothetical protein
VLGVVDHRRASVIRPDGGAGLTFRQRVSLEAEVLFLRRQLALYVDRRVKTQATPETTEEVRRILCGTLESIDGATRF